MNTFNIFFSKIKRSVELLIEILALTLAYFLGIGPIWLISKLVGKKFLEKKYRQSSFKNYDSLIKDKLMRKMY